MTTDPHLPRGHNCATTVTNIDRGTISNGEAYSQYDIRILIKFIKQFPPSIYAYRDVDVKISRRNVRALSQGPQPDQNTKGEKRKQGKILNERTKSE